MRFPDKRDYAAYPCRARRYLQSRRSQLVRQEALRVLAAGQGVQAGVSGDPVQPCPKRTALDILEAVKAAPSTQICLLHQILCFVYGAKHTVTMHLEFAAERFREPSKLIGGGGLRLM